MDDKYLVRNSGITEIDENYDYEEDSYYKGNAYYERERDYYDDPTPSKKDYSYPGGYRDFCNENLLYRSSRMIYRQKLREIYMLLRKKKYHDIIADDKNRDIAYRCCYGLLLRHAIETIVYDLARTNNVPYQASVEKTMNKLMENVPFDTTPGEINLLKSVKKPANEIAHLI